VRVVLAVRVLLQLRHFVQHQVELIRGTVHSAPLTHVRKETKWLGEEQQEQVVDKIND
jgi:hypothetical protein